LKFSFDITYFETFCALHEKKTLHNTNNTTIFPSEALKS
jgi:hypothetical protein